MKKKALEVFVRSIAKCSLGINGQFNYVIEMARELVEKMDA